MEPVSEVDEYVDPYTVLRNPASFDALPLADKALVVIAGLLDDTVSFDDTVHPYPWPSYAGVSGDTIQVNLYSLRGSYITVWLKVDRVELI